MSAPHTHLDRPLTFATLLNEVTALSRYATNPPVRFRPLKPLQDFQVVVVVIVASHIRALSGRTIPRKQKDKLRGFVFCLFALFFFYIKKKNV